MRPIGFVGVLLVPLLSGCAGHFEEVALDPTTSPTPSPSWVPVRFVSVEGAAERCNSANNTTFADGCGTDPQSVELLLEGCRHQMFSFATVADDAKNAVDPAFRPYVDSNSPLKLDAWNCARHGFRNMTTETRFATVGAVQFVEARLPLDYPCAAVVACPEILMPEYRLGIWTAPTTAAHLLRWAAASGIRLVEATVLDLPGGQTPTSDVRVVAPDGEWTITMPGSAYDGAGTADFCPAGLDRFVLQPRINVSQSPRLSERNCGQPPHDPTPAVLSASSGALYNVTRSLSGSSMGTASRAAAADSFHVSLPVKPR